jgi:hypothetical protein
MLSAIIIIIISFSMELVADNGIFKQCMRTTFDYNNENNESCYRAWGLIKPIVCVDNATVSSNNNNRTLMFCPVSIN